MNHVQCCGYVSYTKIVVSVWSYDFSSYSETNVHKKEMMNWSEYRLYQKVTSQLVETFAYVFTDIPYFFIKNAFKLLQDKSTQNVTKIGKTET